MNGYNVNVEVPIDGRCGERQFDSTLETLEHLIQGNAPRAKDYVILIDLKHIVKVMKKARTGK